MGYLDISKSCNNSGLKDMNEHRAHYSVVIVGGGIAGLGAARELQSRGIDSFIILEASNRIGGRVNSVKTESGITIDLGAQWLHGEDGNSIYSLSQGRKLLQDKLSLDGAGDFCTENGERISTELVDETLDVLSDISEECKKFFDLSEYKSEINSDMLKMQMNNLSTGGRNFTPFNYSEEGWSVGAFYVARFKEYLDSCSNDSKFETLLKKSLFNWVLRWELIDNACDTLFDISAKRWGEYFICSGRNNMNPMDGMLTLLNSASEGVPRSKVLFNRNVVEIDYDVGSCFKRGKLTRSNGQSPIIIKCSDCTVFCCDHVIVTASLGVLKKRSDMFQPALPSNLQRVINSIGFGTLDKIFLEFSYEWWTKDFIGLQFIWTNEDLLDEAESRKEWSWYRGMTGFDAIPGKRNILCGWIGGREAVEMERLSSIEVQEKCVSLLKKFSGNANIPKPVAIYRSSWNSNPLFEGSYSNRPTSTEDVSSQELNAPIYTNGEKVPLLVFAGEANNLSFFSTVHGAFDNGIKQSRHYINHRSRRSFQSGGIKSKL